MSAVKRTFTATVMASAVALSISTSHAASVTAVTASAVTERQSVVVAFDDLDLSSPKAQETLFNRLRSAAKAVCGSRNPHTAGGLTQALRNGDCYNAALSKALAAVSEDTVAVSR